MMARHLRLRLRDGDAGLEAGDGISARIVSVGQFAAAVRASGIQTCVVLYCDSP